MNKVLKFLLLPFAILYNLVTFIRNKMYDYRLLASQKPEVSTIVVGNLKVGGTGKTPFVEWITDHILTLGIEFCILSRGYGRRTTGFWEADERASSSTIGDEPLQYYNKYKQKGVRIFVGEDRVSAINTIEHLYPTIKLVVLDDAFQHRSLRANWYILLTEFDKPFWKDYLLPMGMLRESRQGAKRASAVIVTKSPQREMTAFPFDGMKRQVEEYVNENTPVFFNYIEYLPLEPVFQEGMRRDIDNLILISGIANPSHFERYCRQEYNVIRSFVFADHYDYTEKDVTEIVEQAKLLALKGLVICTTEKDAGRLLKYKAIFAGIPLVYLPIRTTFYNDEELQFKNLVGSWISSSVC